jgi:hypothetical protein
MRILIDTHTNLYPLSRLPGGGVVDRIKARLTVPRGATAQLVGILRGAGVRYCLDDRRRTQAPVDFTFLGELHDFQLEAVSVMATRARTTVYGG